MKKIAILCCVGIVGLEHLSAMRHIDYDQKISQGMAGIVKTACRQVRQIRVPGMAGDDELNAELNAELDALAGSPSCRDSEPSVGLDLKDRYAGNGKNSPSRSSSSGRSSRVKKLPPVVGPSEHVSPIPAPQQKVGFFRRAVNTVWGGITRFFKLIFCCRGGNPEED
jgi:hypothetical protein